MPPRIAKRCQDVSCVAACLVFVKQKTADKGLVDCQIEPAPHRDDSPYSGSDTSWPVPLFDHSGGANHLTFPDVFRVSDVPYDLELVQLLNRPGGVSVLTAGAALRLYGNLRFVFHSRPVSVFDVNISFALVKFGCDIRRKGVGPCGWARAKRGHRRTYVKIGRRPSVRVTCGQ